MLDLYGFIHLGIYYRYTVKKCERIIKCFSCIVSFQVNAFAPITTGLAVDLPDTILFPKSHPDHFPATNNK